MSKTLNYKSCFDVIGPAMVGPSSSHTAGAIKITLTANALLQTQAEKVICRYYESFAETHQGHGTDYAVAAGILNFNTQDTRVPRAIELVKEAGIDLTYVECKKEKSPVGHENTIDLILSAGGRTVRLIGASVGGGTIEVRHYEADGFVVNPTGPLPMVVNVSQDASYKERLQKELDQLGLSVSHTIFEEKDGWYLAHFELEDFLSKDKAQVIETLRDEKHAIYILK
ncbi:serine dehydratase beta chain [Dolosicoccus paucivorans]|uniref:serine dehydratase beta chain n=1 Tax=Dolosicoccus paucivorans TaxID=84521 RepID=UPI000882A6A1|nr:serine dehydratase beta chain [Dolosicoccus paucivorans]SDI55281.1 L-serine dehydratase [Dolosicoccus paucivorans]